MYTIEEIDRLRIVLEDLEDLYSEFGGIIYKGSKIRKASSTLNMLLIENELLTAYKIIFGRESSPIIIAPNLDVFLDVDMENSIECAMAGGATYFSAEICLMMLTKKGTPKPKTAYPPEEYKLNLSRYLSGSSFYFDKNRISRLMLISYMANKRGGKHIDYKRKNDKKNVYFRILDGRGEFFHFGEMIGLYIELQAIIQALQKSTDIQIFIKRAKEVLREEILKRRVIN